MREFSYRTRAQALTAFETEIFDVLVVGGGITGAAVARDAALRGLKVALVEKNDFAFGTSSRSSKLIHGGLRYLENFEFRLVFEALSERAHLLKNTPNLVKPLQFFFPIYEGDPVGINKLDTGLWLYDVLSSFRTPGFHARLSNKEFLNAVPGLKSEGLKGGFRYFDAQMWDDRMVVATLRDAARHGAQVANYVEALRPLWGGDRVIGFFVRDQETGHEFILRSHRTVFCGGPWTDELGKKIDPEWQKWLKPSKGIHLVLDHKRLPVPGAVVMQGGDGRISFVMPRLDFGEGVVVVGTTDSPGGENPDRVQADSSDVEYLLKLLNKYFPNQKISRSDIISHYVGVRPLVGLDDKESTLQKVSREHTIASGPGEVVVVAGGKYTTHRKMAEEIVDFLLQHWREDFVQGASKHFPHRMESAHSEPPLNAKAMSKLVKKARRVATKNKWNVSESLWEQYGAEALWIVKDQLSRRSEGVGTREYPGFSMLEEQLRFETQYGMVVHLEDFYLRRSALFLARRDHGLDWAETLAKVFVEHVEDKSILNVSVAPEVERLKRELEFRKLPE